MMRDPANYADPLKFDGFRFVRREKFAALGITSLNLDLRTGISRPEKGSQLTDVADWQVWGTGRMAWRVSSCFII